MQAHRLRCCCVVLLLFGWTEERAAADDLSPLERLGKKIFFDKNLSSPAGQSCASCHGPEVGFTGPDSAVNAKSGIYPGAAPGRIGNRKPPTIAYSVFGPSQRFQADDQTWVGGQFWDGRVDDLIDQAKGPFLNPLEMNNASARDVVEKVRNSDYRDLYESVAADPVAADPSVTDLIGAMPGDETSDGDQPAAANGDAKGNGNAKGAGDQAEIDKAFDLIALAITAYEATTEVNPFSSKYDYYLTGRGMLTPREFRGMRLFGGKANCSTCHPHYPEEDGSLPLFTNFSYANVGTPRNESNPFYRTSLEVNPDGRKYRDLGLGAVVNDGAQAGKFKVPTLRNVAKKPSGEFVKAYMHNGVFKSLKSVVGFYNLRDTSTEKYLAPDVPENVNHDGIGHLGLDESEEDAIVAFLETLSDGYVPPATNTADVSAPPADTDQKPREVPEPPAQLVEKPANLPATPAGFEQMPVEVPAAPQEVPTASGEFPATAPPVTSRDRFRTARDWLRVQRFRTGARDQAGRENGPRRR